ncbi:MAG TPA: GNAT family N-acetyltransferase [Nocardioidaceae bacterium]|nr:GNAT family N-acetyltransferase [Nocardioidaceae bacterium]
MTFQIRLAEPAEYAAIGALTVEAYQSDELLHADSEYVAELADAASRARDAELWVAVDEHALLGTVTHCPAGSPYRELAGDGEGEFRMLAVSPTHRRQGAARALVEHCITRSIAAGDRQVVICSLRQMRGAHRLYEGIGFVRCAERDWQPVPAVELLAFALDLRPVSR